MKSYNNKNPFAELGDFIHHMSSEIMNYSTVAKEAGIEAEDLVELR